MKSISDTFAVVGASYLQLPLVQKAKDMGYRVICFAWEDGAVCKEACDKFYPVSIVDKEEILAICREEKICGISTIASDVAAPTAAYVAEKMGLPGNDYHSACAAHDKSLMRDAFSRNGIPCPSFMVVDSVDGLPDNLMYPLIVKPCDRSGSLSVTEVFDRMHLDAAVKEALDSSFCHKAMVEEFIEGREISVEFISSYGIHYPLTITDKVTTGAPHFVELEHHQPAELSVEQYSEIFALTGRALDALGITNGASHTEYKIRPDGSIYIIETGARMGGDFIGSDLVQLSTGYDFLRGVVEVATGTFTPPVLNENRYAGVYFLCKETDRLLPYFSGRNLDCVVRKELMGDGTCVEVSKSADRCGYLIYQSSSRLVI